MAKPSTRLVMNRQAVGEIRLAVADGVNEVCRTIVEESHPPDEDPIGVGLVKEGGWAVWVGRKKVAGGSLDGSQPAKPRQLQLGDENTVTGIAGFGFPAKFNEVGTSHQPGRPFLWPTAVRVKGIAADIMRSATGAALAKLKGS